MRNGYSIAFFVCFSMAFPAFADQIIAPSADGTLVDGGGYGPFDGIADTADWSFNQSSYEGAVTASREAATPIEHRLVFEFDLSAVTRQPPMDARFKFRLRGAPRFPAETAFVQVFAYPSDLVESLGDFEAGPAVLLGQVSVAAFQPGTLFEIDVSDQVNSALQSTAKRLAIRLQLIPQTLSAQAFMDAVDSDSTTKPSVVISDFIAGDFDHDGDLDVDDLSFLVSCMNGPSVGPTPGCSVCDFNGDSDVDLGDYQIFEKRYTIYGQ